MSDKPASELQCLSCGYYCSGKGGFGCIDKPTLVAIEEGTMPDNTTFDTFPVPYTLTMYGDGTFQATWKPFAPSKGLPDAVYGKSGTSAARAMERLKENLIQAGVL